MIVRAGAALNRGFVFYDSVAHPSPLGPVCVLTICGLAGVVNFFCEACVGRLSAQG
tara:strand:- start:480 stop:647 length:168 start_codon:yes stop_codon:yes gene_type:complete